MSGFLEILSAAAIIGGSTSVGIGVVAFIGRSFFQNLLKADLESHKASLQNQFFKSQKIYERKVEVLAELYSLSVNAGEAVRLAVSKEGRLTSDEHPRLSHDVNKFKEYYQSHRIWLDLDCCEAIDSLLEQHGAFDSVLTMRWIQEEGQGKTWVSTELLETHRRISSELPKAQENLHNAFQRTLGVLEGK